MRKTQKGDFVPKKRKLISSESEPVGYEALIRRFALQVLPHHHTSFILNKGNHRTTQSNGKTTDYFRSTYRPNNDLWGNLEFALKYDGINLEILSLLFQKISARELMETIRKRPTSKYSRQAWFLYEFLTGKRLGLPDMNQGNYIDLLETDDYYTAPPISLKRYRLNNNLLGGPGFCPMVRRTPELKSFEKKALDQEVTRITKKYSPKFLERAINYLYTKETRSSFEIEHVHPTEKRIHIFSKLLRKAGDLEKLDKNEFIHLQNLIVEERFKDSDFRKRQNYVGESWGYQKEYVHYISPKPSDVEGLMGGLMACNDRLGRSLVHPLIHAAAIAFGFVFIHPFEDGNGRLHRFLIHHILAKRGFTPKEIVFPISATLLNELKKYDAILESFSKPLMDLLDYEVHEDGSITAENNDPPHYRYVDMTFICERMFGILEKTIQVEFTQELDFIQRYDRITQAIQGVVDMPDSLINLFVRLCLQNKGKLSLNKRKAHFSKLTDKEIKQLEAIVQSQGSN